MQPDRRRGSLPGLRHFNADQVETLIAGIASTLIRPVPTAAKWIVLRRPEALDGQTDEGARSATFPAASFAHQEREEEEIVSARRRVARGRDERGEVLVRGEYVPKPFQALTARV